MTAREMIEVLQKLDNKELEVWVGLPTSSGSEAPITGFRGFETIETRETPEGLKIVVFDRDVA